MANHSDRSTASKAEEGRGAGQHVIRIARPAYFAGRRCIEAAERSSGLALWSILVHAVKTSCPVCSGCPPEPHNIPHFLDTSGPPLRGSHRCGGVAREGRSMRLSAVVLNRNAVAMAGCSGPRVLGAWLRTSARSTQSDPLNPRHRSSLETAALGWSWHPSKRAVVPGIGNAIMSPPWPYPHLELWRHLQCCSGHGPWPERFWPVWPTL